MNIIIESYCKFHINFTIKKLKIIFYFEILVLEMGIIFPFDKEED